MLTSRAEHRLVLGIDSARERVMERGANLGLVRWSALEGEKRLWEGRRKAREMLDAGRLNPDRQTRETVRDIAGIEMKGPCTWADILRRQDVDSELVGGQLDCLRELDPRERKIVVGRLRYEGYLGRHERERERLRKLRGVRIPKEFEARGISGLSREVVEEFERCRPRTLAEAEGLPGITPAGFAILAARILERKATG
jgi:tRNA uridine 5-carboxymethylaminomethyl modification enzyme